MVFKSFSIVSGKARLLLAVLMFSAAAVVVVFLLSGKHESPETAKRISRPDPAREEQLKKLTQDSDGDGLKDWEEGIFRTDPLKPDTDGDQTSDGDEIKQNRDPLRKGPNDYVATTTPPGGPSGFGNTDNLTRRLVQSFGSRFIGARAFSPDGNMDPAEAGNEIVQNIMSATTTAPVNVFSRKDIRVSGDNSAGSANAYINSFNTVIHGSFRGLEDKPEIVIFSEALETDDFTRLSQLDKYLEGFDRATLLLKRMAVPSDFADLHVAYLNNLARQQQAVTTMRHAEIDVVKATLGVREYAVTANVFIQIVKNMRKELLKKTKV